MVTVAGDAANPSKAGEGGGTKEAKDANDPKAATPSWPGPVGVADPASGHAAELVWPGGRVEMDAGVGVGAEDSIPSSVTSTEMIPAATSAMKGSDVASVGVGVGSGMGVRSHTASAAASRDCAAKLEGAAKVEEKTEEDVEDDGGAGVAVEGGSERPACSRAASSPFPWPRGLPGVCPSSEAD
jgi:hypothetical protein